MSDIEWSPWIRHDWPDDCPDEVAPIAVTIKEDDGVMFGSDGKTPGILWSWSRATHYRIPMEDYRRITGMPEWSEAPEWAVALAQDKDGWWRWHSVHPTACEWTWKAGPGSNSGMQSQGEVFGDWRDTLQGRPTDQLDSHPNSEPDADRYSVGADTIDDSDDQPPRSKYHREIAPGVWVDVYDVLNAWGVTNPALQHLIKKALAPGERGHKTLDQDMRDILASAKRAQELG